MLVAERGLTGLEKKIINEIQLFTDTILDDIFKAMSKKERMDIVELDQYVLEAQRVAFTHGK